LAYTETKILHPESGKLLATGLHTKFIGKSHGHPKSVTFDESGDNVVEGEIED
jgi:acyl-coenzyme A thioesterase 13